MARETQKREIDGVTYHVTQLGSWASLRTMTRLSRVVGPLLARAGLEAGESMPEAVADALRSLPVEDVEAIVRELTPGAKVSRAVHLAGAKSIEIDLDFEEEFAGRPAAMVQWITFALEVNYAAFFADARAVLLGALARGKVKESRSPNTSAPGGASSE